MFSVGIPEKNLNERCSRCFKEYTIADCKKRNSGVLFSSVSLVIDNRFISLSKTFSPWPKGCLSCGLFRCTSESENKGCKFKFYNIISKHVYHFTYTNFSFISCVHFDLTHIQIVLWIYHFNLVPFCSFWALEFNPNTLSGFWSWPTIKTRFIVCTHINSGSISLITC